jgi:hypothetical protein
VRCELLGCLSGSHHGFHQCEHISEVASSETAIHHSVDVSLHPCGRLCATVRVACGCRSDDSASGGARSQNPRIAAHTELQVITSFQ